MRTSRPLLSTVATLCVAAAPIAWGQGTTSLATQPLPMPVIKSIEVQYAGPATVSKARVLANMRTKVGRPYSDAAVEEDIRNLYATGSITNVRIYGEPPDKDGIKVIVVIGTKPTVKEVEIEGATQVKSKAIRKKIATKPKQAATESVVEEDRQTILELYRDKGYKDTVVKTKIEVDEKTNEAIVRYTIVEAPKTIVRRIKFEGNETFKTSTLRKVIKTRTHNILSVFTKAGLLQNEQIAEDIDALRSFYQNHGYLDVQVSEAQITRKEGSAKVEVLFSIKEGAQYHTGKVTILGAHVFTTDEVGKVLKMQPGSVYSPEAAANDQKAIQNLYGARGYIDLQIIAETTPGGATTKNVTYRLDEGTQSYVERVNIAGNVTTKDKVIRREMAVGPGEVYNSVRVDASKARLQNLNYFERVDVYPADTLNPGKKDINVIVQEKRTGSLNFGAGFSTIDSVMGFVELTQSNFDITNWPALTGGGQRFRVRLQAGSKRKDFVVSLTEPYFLDYPVAVGTELFYHDATYLSNDYNQSNYGGSIFARKAINQWTALRLDYRLEGIKLNDVYEEAPPAILTTGSTSWVKSQISPSVSYDTRDSVFLTRKGSRVELSGYVSGGPLGGNEPIYGGDLEASHYFSLPWDTILILNGEVAAVSAFDGGFVPVFDTLYLGGSNNLRGFKFRDVSPKQNKNGTYGPGGESVGGNSLARATVEYTYPIIDRVRGAFFYDAGFIDNASEYASDAGIGVRLDLPIGPVRIDYGVPLQKGPTEAGSGHFNFNIGYQF